MRRRTWVAALATGLLVGAVVIVIAGIGGVDGQWARVRRGDLVVSAKVDGELVAVDSVELGPPQISELWDFKISFLAEEGAEVAQGQPVIGFDATQLQQQLQEKTAERDSAEKELEKKITDVELEQRKVELELAEAHGRLRRTALLLDVPAEVASRNELELARIDHRLAEVEIDHLQSKRKHLKVRSEAEIAAMRERRDRAAARVAELEEHLAMLTVAAPRAGTVIYVSDWRGNKKKVGDSTWRGEKILEIPDLAKMRATGEINEADAGRVATGQKVVLRLEAHPDLEYAGVVRRIHRSVQQKSWNDPRKVVRVDVELDHTDRERMRPGMRCRGRIETERLRELLLVPREAVAIDSEGATVVLGGLLGEHSVRPSLGRRNEEFFEVLDGLEEGDRVLVPTVSKGGEG
jgi:HlyD family secretion protein